MKTAIYYNNSDVRNEEMPVPDISDDEILFKTIASGICGSDLMEWYRIKKAPLVLGHEVAGIVEKKGKNVTDFDEGEKVFVTHHVPCGSCKYCKNGNDTACDTLRKTNFYPGGFSEYIRIPAINIEKGMLNLPSNVGFEEGTFIEPLGCAVRGQKRLGIKQDDSLLVMGCGPAGILHIKLAKAKGVKKIMATDINPYRIQLARLNSAIPIHALDDVHSILKYRLNGELADKVIVCTGALPAAKQAFNCVDRGGTVLYFAVPRPDEDVVAPLNEFWKDEKTIAFSYGAGMRDNKEALELIASGSVDIRDMITHRLPLEKAKEGFRIASKEMDAMKVIFYPHGITKD
ncbi:MAG: alcohol dehydrogenase catalytic domain-containing protein [Candidatus Nanoarchaeia archaeon]|nr:alcohol dehydrogenase catalytic domain-containing protein [Candidatus Nanoarchaeia archaeon]